MSPSWSLVVSHMLGLQRLQLEPGFWRKSMTWNMAGQLLGTVQLSLHRIPLFQRAPSRTCRGVVM